MSGGPPTHVPPEHVSLVVQALPSSHGTVLGACTQPETGSHESVVQTFPSSQASGGPPWHAPSEHMSRVVQEFPSSHPAVLGVMTQSPVAGSQESSVQTLPSSQCRDWPMHLPPPQTSPVVQALPSSHGAVFGVWTQPLPESQESSVQGLPSSQSSDGPPTHAPAAQVSAVVQALPSWHGFALKPTTWHVPVPLQVPSSVQTLASLQAQPPCSKKQTAEQQSPLTVFPSSHSSPGSSTPLPQRAPTATPPLPSPNLAPVSCARRKATISSCKGESSASNACAAATASE